MNTTVDDALKASEEVSDDSNKQVASTVLDALEAPRRGSDDDLKGKQLIEFPGSATELGQSSSANQILADECLFHCTICMEPKHLTESFDVKPCSHKFCNTCTSGYVTAKVLQNATSIECPDPGCKDGSLEPDMCRLIIPARVFDRWGVALCELALGTRKFYCPYRDCSVLSADDGADDGGGLTNAECPHCCRMVCARCKVPWHEGISCEGFQQLDEDERGREDLMLRKLATDSKWQRCSQCRMYVEKTEGCMFMNCRCGFGFCYACGSPMSKDYHYCGKCQR